MSNLKTYFQEKCVCKEKLCLYKSYTRSYQGFISCNNWAMKL